MASWAPVLLLLAGLLAATPTTLAQASRAAGSGPMLRVAMLHADAGWTPALDIKVRTALPDTLDAPPDPWFGRDKALHAGGSFLLTLSAQYVLTSKLDASEGTGWPIAAGTTLALGLAKEIADSRRPVRPLFSVRDLVADAVGVALASALIAL